MRGRMSIGLVGPGRRGLAAGLNESAGYLGVAATAALSGVVASAVAPRTVVWVGALVLIGLGSALTIAFVRDTRDHMATEERESPGISDAAGPGRRAKALGAYRFWRDCGLVAGGVGAGLVADVSSAGSAIWLVAAVTAASGLWVALAD